MTEESGSIDAPRPMSDEELSTQLAAEDAEANEAPAGEQKYESSDDFLVAIGLSKYVLAFHQQELDDLEQLVACTDEYLKTVIRMKPDDVTVFREALVRDGLVERPSYKDATDFLNAQRLGQFIASFALNEIKAVEDLHGCSDVFLTRNIGMKKAHLLKFRRGLKEAGLDSRPEPGEDGTYSVYEAHDGFRGSYAEVLAHEKKLEAAKAAKVAKKEISDPHARVVYKSPDGAFEGTWEEIHAREEEEAVRKREEALRREREEHEKRVLMEKAAEGRKTYKDMHDFLTSYGLGHYMLALHNHGVDFLSELHGCSEEFLVEKADMKKAHVIKFLRGREEAGLDTPSKANEDGTYDLYQASDGFRGTHGEVLEHEKKLEAAREELFQSEDGFIGTYEEMVEHEETKDDEDEEPLFHPLTEQEKNAYHAHLKKATDEKQSMAAYHPPKGKASRVHTEVTMMRIYEAHDGFVGTYAQVLAHEKMLAGDFVGEDAEGNHKIMEVYVASDGHFHGTYDEVAAHEAKLGRGGTGDGEDEGETLTHVYYAPDGFHGTLDEVIAHEKKSGLSEEAVAFYQTEDGFVGTYAQVAAHEGRMQGAQGEQEEVLHQVYHAPDGFHGTFEEVEAHEAKLAAGTLDEDKAEELVDLYEARDGFKGTFKEVEAYERRMGFKADADGKYHPKNAAPNDDGNYHIYEAPDGFRGTLEQVEAYEEEHGLKYAPPKKECFTHRAVFMRIYEASDGFHGSHDEVLEHERKLKRKEMMVHTGNEIYETDDGFKGTHDEIVEHEARKALRLQEEHEALRAAAEEERLRKILGANPDLHPHHEEHLGDLRAELEALQAHNEHLKGKVAIHEEAHHARANQLAPLDRPEHEGHEDHELEALKAHHDELEVKLRDHGEAHQERMKSFGSRDKIDEAVPLDSSDYQIELRSSDPEAP